MPHKSVRQRLPYDERREQFVEKAVQFFARDPEELMTSVQDEPHEIPVAEDSSYRMLNSRDDSSFKKVFQNYCPNNED